MLLDWIKLLSVHSRKSILLSNHDYCKASYFDKCGGHGQEYKWMGLMGVYDPIDLWVRKDHSFRFLGYGCHKNAFVGNTIDGHILKPFFVL